jgi:hypothetical protein
MRLKKYWREAARMLADVIVWLAIAAMWVMCLLDVSVAWTIWQTKTGIYGIVGVLALFYAPPIMFAYWCANSFASRSYHAAIIFPFLIGLGALLVANQITR